MRVSVSTSVTMLACVAVCVARAKRGNGPNTAEVSRPRRKSDEQRSFDGGTPFGSVDASRLR